MPVPFRLEVCGLLLALSLTLNTPVLVPLAVGVKVTLIVHFPLAIRLVVQVVALAPVVIDAFGGEALIGEWGMIAAMVALLFLSAYVCNCRLADGRPGPERATEYYLFIAAGGLIGGAFNALIAPSLFSDIVEYPLTLVLAMALRSAGGKPAAGRRPIVRSLRVLTTP